MSDDVRLDAATALVAALRVAPTAIATSVVGLRTLPRASALALFGAVAWAIWPASAQMQIAPLVALAQGMFVAAGALVPLVTATMALDATARLAELPRSWDEYFGLLVALSFLMMGGPADLGLALVSPPMAPSASAGSLIRGVMVGLAIASPMLVARIALDLSFALTARTPLGTTWVVGRRLLLTAIVALLARRLVWKAL